MVYVLLTDGFEDLEALAPVDILRRGGLETMTVGVSGQMVTSAHNVTLKADILLADVEKEKMELLVLPGGPGHSGLMAAEGLISFAAQKGLLIGAICAAPSILGGMGLLKGRKAVCYPGYESKLIGAEVLHESVVTDGNITTARGAGVSVEFALCLLAQLKGTTAMQEVREEIVCPQGQ